MKQFFAILTFLICTSAFSQTQSENVVIGTKKHIYSTILKEDREFWVYLPPDYNDSTYALQSYPVLYLLDGEAHFLAVSGMMHRLSAGVHATTVIPQMIIVAILNTDRNRDLTPSRSLVGADGKEINYLSSTGGGENFVSFLKNELMPRIDSSYRTVNYRMLIGHSFGGLTAINILLNHTDLFNSYIAIDPSLWWNHRELIKQAETKLAQQNFTGKKLYLTVALLPMNKNFLQAPKDSFGKKESLVDNKMFTDLLNKNKQNGLQYAYEYLSNDDHGSSPFISEYNGLRFIFSNYMLADDGVFLPAVTIKKHYQQVSKELGYTILPPPVTLYWAGWDFIQNKEYDRALALYNLNKENFPKSYMVYMALGEVYEAKGEKERALEFYQKALQFRNAPRR